MIFLPVSIDKRLVSSFNKLRDGIMHFIIGPTCTFVAFTLLTLVHDALLYTMCENDCWKTNSVDQELRNGEFVCVRHPSNDISVESPCVAKCRGYKPDSDQTKCFCEMCKDNQNYQNFCARPDDPRLSSSIECDAMVCTGKAKFHGRYCKGSNDEPILLQPMPKPEEHICPPCPLCRCPPCNSI